MNENERKAFEAWYSDEGLFPRSIERNGGSYILMQAQQAWTAWQARAALDEAASQDIDTLVNRFLAWPLPRSVCSDACVSMPDYPHRCGTNLLTADEAKAMFQHCLGAHASAASKGFDAEFLSKRLARVAGLVGVPMPDMTHEQIAEVAGTILGQIASKLESTSVAPVGRDAILEEAAKITESFCACDDPEDQEEMNWVLRNRASRIRSLKSSASNADTEKSK
jgi:hypothetical protein